MEITAIMDTTVKDMEDTVATITLVTITTMDTMTTIVSNLIGEAHWQIVNRFKKKNSSEELCHL